MQGRKRRRSVRERVVEPSEPLQSGSDRPSLRQLSQLSLFVGIPFCGFGFADNFIMIVAGDAIDFRFAAYGITTMAAAGLGNWISDVIGLGIGDVIERGATKMGLSNGNLTPAQERTQLAKFVNLAAKVLGITLGCFLGMCPLLFLKKHKLELSDADTQLYEEIFCKMGMSPTDFAELRAIGTRKTASANQVLLKGGVPHRSVILLLKGEAFSYNVCDETLKKDEPVARYTGKLDADADKEAESTNSEGSLIRYRGHIIGGSALGDSSLHLRLNNVVAKRSTEYIEWDLSTLRDLCNRDAIVHRSFLLIQQEKHTQEKLSDTQIRALENYKMALHSVLVDGRLAVEERSFIELRRKQSMIGDEAHQQMLAELGWSKEEWDKGEKSGRSAIMRSAALSQENQEKLQEAVAMIEAVLADLKRADLRNSGG